MVSILGLRKIIGVSCQMSKYKILGLAADAEFQIKKLLSLEGNASKFYATPISSRPTHTYYYLGTLSVCLP